MSIHFTKNLKDLKNLSITVPKRNLPVFKSIISLYESGHFQNYITAKNLILKLSGSGKGPMIAIEKVNAMQSAVINEQSKIIQKFIPAINNLDHGI